MSIKTLFFILFFSIPSLAITYQYNYLSDKKAVNKEINIASFYGVYTALSLKERKIAITLESVLQLSNDHVGDDWNHFLSVNKKVIKKGETEIFILEPRAPLRIIAHSIEEDESFSDSGDDKIDFIYSDLIAIDKTRFELDVTVVENSGQYAGNLAKWKFLFVIRRV